ncbi:PKS-NRPS hybrid synthetase psoA [Trichinella spiralis]|uniref:PKS-NRPS hybrid synthetase psoA n=1 Tax=Trichinella spiralis TaxID=6334 RepID=A0ABR3K938_TRISP
MADELENFFKSKKKLAAKKRNVQNPDMLCRRLEQAVQVQEMYDYADGEEWPVHSYEQPEPQEKPKEEGDSEWLEVDDSQNFAPTVEDLKMNDDIDEDEEETEQPPPKQRTWNVNPEINGAAEVEKPVESNLENKTNENVYVPPCMRNRLNAPAKRDANFRTEEFPTLADAEVILKSDAELNKQKQVDPPNPWMKSKPPKQEEQEPLYVPVFARRGNNIGRGGNNIGRDNGIGPGSSNASGISNGPGTSNGPGNSSGSSKEQRKDKDNSETESDVYVPPYLRNRSWYMRK